LNFFSFFVIELKKPHGDTNAVHIGDQSYFLHQSSKQNLI